MKADGFYEEEYVNGKPSGIINIVGTDVFINKDNKLNTLTIFMTNKERKLDVTIYELVNTKEGVVIRPSISSSLNNKGAHFTSFPGYHLFVDKVNNIYVFYINEKRIVYKFYFKNVKKISKKEAPLLK